MFDAFPLTHPAFLLPFLNLVRVCFRLDEPSEQAGLQRVRRLVVAGGYYLQDAHRKATV